MYYMQLMIHFRKKKLLYLLYLMRIIFYQLLICPFFFFLEKPFHQKKERIHRKILRQYL